MNDAIETQDLTKNFPLPRDVWSIVAQRGSKKKECVAALKNLTLRVREGEIFALLGPNGAGKTTFLKILASLLLPNSGTAKVCGYDCVRDAQKVKPIISLVIGEERSFYWRLTGRQNLSFFAALYDLSAKQTRERITRVQNLLELEGLDKRYETYSAGMKQSLALARALLNDAKLILMDEPTKSLDPLAADRLRALIREKLLGSGRTVFFTSHDIQETESLASRIAILHHGNLLACGTLPEISQRFGDPCLSLKEIYRRTVEGAASNVP